MINNLQNANHSNNTQENDLSGIIPDDILENIPGEDKGKIAAIIKHTMISGVMRSKNPLSDKITPEHISEIIKNSNEQDIRDREERKSERNYNLLLLIIALLFIAFLIIFLKKNEQLLIKIIIGIVSFIGGYGFGKTKQRSNS